GIKKRNSRSAQTNGRFLYLYPTHPIFNPASGTNACRESASITNIMRTFLFTIALINPNAITLFLFPGAGTCRTTVYKTILYLFPGNADGNQPGLCNRGITLSADKKRVSGGADGRHCRHWSFRQSLAFYVGTGSGHVA